MSRQLLPFPSKNETSLSFTIENDDDDDYEGKNYFLTGNYLSKKKNDSFYRKNTTLLPILLLPQILTLVYSCT